MPHTPGELRVQEGYDGAWLVIADEGAHCEVLAECPANDVHDAQANAILFAAAPDLLAALEELYDDQRSPLTEPMKKAQAAIAKAKGE